MGEAKRRRQFIASRPCRCGSPKPAGQCCFNGKRWYKAPARINLTDPTHTGKHQGCYLGGLGSCSSKLSREHLISRAVLLVLEKGGGLEAGGLPWMHDDRQAITVDTIVAKCLCTSHNSALSRLDTNAARFFRAIHECELLHDGKPRHYMFSGHDIERWLLKTTAGMAASRNLSTHGSRDVRLGQFVPSVDVALLLQNIRAWPQTAGLYSTQRLGQQFRKHRHFWLEPMTHNGEVAAIRVSIQGLEFILFACPTIWPEGSPFAFGQFRPSSLVFKMPGFTNIIELCWEDGLIHRPVQMEFTPDPQQAKQKFETQAS